MCSILLISHYKRQNAARRASDVIRQELQRPVLDERERAARLRFPKAVMLLAVSALIFFC